MRSASARDWDIFRARSCVLNRHRRRKESPHVGWNDIEKRVETPLFDGIEDGTNYYFVHSYHFKVRDEGEYCRGYSVLR